MHEPSTRLAKALFGVGLTVVSQQVTEIDKGILSQLNTELNLGRRLARRYALYRAVKLTPDSGSEESRGGSSQAAATGVELTSVPPAKGGFTRSAPSHLQSDGNDNSIQQWH